MKVAADSVFAKVKKIEQNYDEEFIIADNTRNQNILPDGMNKYMKEVMFPSKSGANSNPPDMAFGCFLGYTVNVTSSASDNVQYEAGSILSTLGNYRGLQSKAVEGFQSADLFDSIYYAYDMSKHLIPGKESEYFFHDPKLVYDGLECRYFSYSGPTSMGKSFVVQTYIEEQIRNG